MRSDIIDHKKVGSLLTAAARSNCPPTAGGFLAPGLGGTGREVLVGRWVLGIGGLPGIFGGPPPPPDTLGFEAIGGGPGFGFIATGGGLFASAEFGLELDGELSAESCRACAFFHGVAEPFEGPMPGKTETGFALESATSDLTGGLTAGVEEVVVVLGGAGTFL